LKEKILYLCTSILSRLINGSKKAHELTITNILVVKLDDIGDMVYALHVFSMLNKKFPEAIIDVVAKPVNHVFFKHVSYVQLYEPGLKKLDKKYDMMIDLRGNFSSLWFAFRQPLKLYFDRGTIRIKNKYNGGQQHEIHTNYAVAKPVLTGLNFEYPTLSFSEVEKEMCQSWLKEREIAQFAILHCGANDIKRRWADKRFAALAMYLIEKKNLNVVFVGGPAEVSDITRIQSLIPHKTYSSAGTFNLLELGALCAEAKLFIGNESGPLHIATAVNTPLIGLFGPGVRVVFYPYHKDAITLHHFDEKSNTNTGLGMDEITIEEVISACESLTV
jgi:ADP-heptose:LPS heptosyltransferase